MQQTQAYKLNLIETSDTFSPAPLNENAQKLEQAVEAARAEAAAGEAALSDRVTVLEGHKLAVGTFTGDGATTHFIGLPFAPIYVLVAPGYNVPCAGVEGLNNHVMLLANGFQVKSDMNRNGSLYSYFAIC